MLKVEKLGLRWSYSKNRPFFFNKDMSMKHKHPKKNAQLSLAKAQNKGLQYMLQEVAFLHMHLEQNSMTFISEQTQSRFNWRFHKC